MKTHAGFMVPWIVAVGLAGCWSPLKQPGPDRIAPGLLPPSQARPPVAQVARPQPPPPATVAPKLATLQIPFIANEGQKDDQVAFYAPTFGGTVFVTKGGELVYALPQREEKPRGVEAVRHSFRTPARPRQSSRGVTLTEALVGGTVREVQGEGRGRATVNVFHGKDPATWRRDIVTYERVSLGEVYAGVELRLRATGHTVEKVFAVRPGAAPEQIRVRVTGGQGVTVTAAGELAVATALGEVRFSRPVAYQEAESQRQLVAVAYVVEEDAYGFRLGAYDRSRELVIDPILAATFLGGSSFDGATALALDSAGNVYVVGGTESTDFPGIGPGSADSTFAGTEAFVVKLDGALSTLLAATFLGGSGGIDVADAPALDGAGNVYVAGFTESADFPGIGEASADATFAGSSEGFVVKLDGALSTLLAATFLGGSDRDTAFALALDSAGNVYVAGETASADFPGVNAGSADATFAGSAEAFVVKLDGALSTLLAATFLGGSDEDGGLLAVLALDAGSNVYVAGRTASADFPGIGGASADATFAGGEAFVAKLDADLSSPPLFDLIKLKGLVDSCEPCPPDPQASLLAKVNEAIKQVLKGHNRPAANALRQFVKRTERFIESGEIPAEDGQRFLALAEDIIAELIPIGRGG